MTTKDMHGRVRAVLFDCDGLLVATEDLFTVAEAAIFADRGTVFTAEHKMQILGHPIPEVGRRMAAMLEVPEDGEAIAGQLLARVESLVAGSLEPLPGVREMVESMRGKVARVVVSNSPRSLVDATLRAAGLHGQFDAVVTVEDAERPKPFPDLYLRAAEIAGEEPSDCLALEDSATGVQAARSAGIRVIGVPKLTGPHATTDIGADWHVPSLRSLAAHALIHRLVPARSGEPAAGARSAVSPAAGD